MSLSFISSSDSRIPLRSCSLEMRELPALAVGDGGVVDSQGIALARRVWRKLPHGAMWAILMVTTIHVTTKLFLVPVPLARDELRQKVMILTETNRPSLLIAGDSRAAWQVMPDVLADSLGVPQSSVINMGQNSCETSEVLAAYREFKDRFAPNPLMVLSVSLFSVDDSCVDASNLNYSMACSMPFVDRAKLLSTERLIRSLFIPERSLYYKIRDHVCGVSGVIPERGFVSRVGTPPQKQFEEKMKAMREFERLDPVIDDLRWKQTANDLIELKSMGVQVIVLDSPHSSYFDQAVEGTPVGEAVAEFHCNLRKLCEDIGIPLLQYQRRDLGRDNPDQYFCNLNHLNRKGAKVLSRLISDDMGQMLEAKVVSLMGYRSEEKMVAKAAGGDQVTP